MCHRLDSVQHNIRITNQEVTDLRSAFLKSIFPQHKTVNHIDLTTQYEYPLSDPDVQHNAINKHRHLGLMIFCEQSYMN